MMLSRGMSRLADICEERKKATRYFTFLKIFFFGAQIPLDEQERGKGDRQERDRRERERETEGSRERGGGGSGV